MIRSYIFQACLLFVILVAFTGCRSSGRDPYRVISFKKGPDVYNWSRSQVSFGFMADSGKVASLPVKENDLLYIVGSGADIFIRYTKDIPDTIEFRVVDTLIFMNDQLVALTIDSIQDMLPWFRQMKTGDIKGLRSLKFTSNIPSVYRQYLAEIAAINPGIDLYLMDDTVSFHEDLIWLSSHFKPLALYAVATEADFAIFQQFPSVRKLSLQIEDSLISGPIPELKNVFDVQIVLNCEKGSFPQNLLSRNKQLNALSINYNNNNHFKLDSLQQLKSLILSTNGVKYPGALDKLFPSLESLLVFDTENLSAAALSGMKHLKELGVPASLPQIVFDSIVKGHPNLEYLQVLQSDTTLVVDYGVLKGAKKMEYLLIAGDSLHYRNLDQLHQLKYLSLPEDLFKDTVEITATQKALPNTVIVPNGGACMGSGWILLLAPLVVIGYYLQRKKNMITS